MRVLVTTDGLAGSVPRVSTTLRAAAARLTAARLAAAQVAGLWPALFRFVRYSLASIMMTVVGYSLLVIGMHVFVGVNAGLLNLVLGLLLAPPSFAVSRVMVWRHTCGRFTWPEFVSFTQAVALGVIASSLLITAADSWWDASPAVAVLVGLAGQGIIFAARFFWLDRVLFAPPPPEFVPAETD